MMSTWAVPAGVVLGQGVSGIRDRKFGKADYS